MCDLNMMKRLAEFSGLALSDGELARFHDDMTQVLVLMDEIKAFDGETAQVAETALPLRADEITCSEKEGEKYLLGGLK